VTFQIPNFEKVSFTHLVKSVSASYPKPINILFTDVSQPTLYRVRRTQSHNR